MRTYKVIPRRRKEVRVYAVEYAIELAADLERLERIIKDLEAIDPWNIGDTITQQQREFCQDMVRSTKILVQSWQRYVKRKLQTEYLAP